MPMRRRVNNTRQTGTSNMKRDAVRKAKLPGKRTASSGKTYDERRANRSDTPAQRGAVQRKRTAALKKKHPLLKHVAGSKRRRR